MKTLCFCLGMLLLAGCGKDDVSPPTPRVLYPALNESPPPPAPASDTSGQPLAEPAAPPPAVITEDSGFQRQSDKIDLLNSLREYAAKAALGDPFALTEKQIEALSKLENPVIN